MIAEIGGGIEEGVGRNESLDVKGARIEDRW